MNDAGQVPVRYEYQFISTPHYTDYIDEGWEVSDVFHSYLPNHHTFIVVFRRKEKIQALSDTLAVVDELEGVK